MTLSNHIYYKTLHDFNYFTGNNHTTNLSWTVQGNTVYSKMNSYIKLNSNEFKIDYLYEIINDLSNILKSLSVSQDDKIFFNFSTIVFIYGNQIFNLEKFVDKKITQTLTYGFPDVSNIYNNNWFDTIKDYKFPLIDPKILTWDIELKKLLKSLHKNFKHGNTQGITYELEDDYFSNIHHTSYDYKLINNTITKDFNVFIMCGIKNQHMYDPQQINLIKTELRNTFMSFNVVYM